MTGEITYEEFEDTKGVIRIRKSEKDRQYNGQQKTDKMTNNDLQNITQNVKDRATQTTLNTGDDLRCFGWVSSSHSTNGTRRSCYFSYEPGDSSKLDACYVFYLSLTVQSYAR